MEFASILVIANTQKNHGRIERMLPDIRRELRIDDRHTSAPHQPPAPEDIELLRIFDRALKVIDVRLCPATLPYLLDSDSMVTPPPDHFRIVVLLNDLDDDTLADVRTIGLDILATSESTSLVVGEASIQTILDLAALDTVRRIEPAELRPAR